MPARITREELKQRIDSGAALIIIDAPQVPHTRHSQIARRAARHARWEALPQVPPGTEVVFYDPDPNELASSHLVARFIRNGIRAAALKGGIGEWLAGNLPIETKDAPKQTAPEPGALKS